MQSISLISLKIIFAAIIFSLTLFFGLLPIKFAKRHVHILCLGSSFASGVFLSASLLHLLPEASSGFRHLNYDAYPIAQLILIITFVILLIIERGIAFYNKHKVGTKSLTPWLLVLVLSIHSIIEGATVGINGTTIGIAIIFFAIIAHKGSESFALTTSLYRHLFSANKIIKILLVFSLTTPCGILIASILHRALHLNSGNILEPIFNAVAAGTFLYLGTEQLVESSDSYEGVGQILALVTGIALMAVVAIWL